MIPGIKIQMGGTDWMVPPLTLGQFRRLQPIIAALGTDDLMRGMDAVCELVAAALSRNYPDMTSEKVADLIDLGNKDAVVEAVMGGSGMVPGEALAVSRGNGSLSTVSLPPPAGTATQ